MSARPALALLLAMALVAVSGCSAGGSGDSSGGAPHAASAVVGGKGGGAARGAAPTGFDGALLPAGLPVRGFTLTDQHGRRVSLQDVRGRVAILAFLYTSSTTTAPLIAAQIRGALDELEPSPAGGGRPGGRAQGGPGRAPVPALAVSVDPAADTPPRVQAFLRATSLTGRLEYLTGAPAELRAVWRAYGVTPASAGPTAYESAAFVLLLDHTGAPRVEIPLEQLTPETLAHDVRRLESE